MKRNRLLVFTVFFLLLSVWPAYALACAMKLTPASPSVNVGDIVTLRLERTTTHRTCVLPLEQTTIKVSGGEVIDPGTWKKGSPDVLEFKVRFTQAGSATVRIERNCPKDGLQTTQTTLQVTEKRAAAKSDTPPGTSTTSTTSTTSNASASTVSAPVPDDSAEHSDKSGRTFSWQQGLTGWWPQYSSHFLSWLAVFTAGMILFLRQIHPLRQPLLLFSLILTGFYLGGCPTPVGAWYYLLAGNRGILGLVLFLLIVPVLLSFFWGRVFCGWMCPIGATQELLKAKKIRWMPPARIDRVLRTLKFILLILFSGITFWTGINYWGHHEPFKTLFNFDGSSFSFILLILAAGWSVVSDRPFCRYFCPLGAILSVTSRFSLSRIQPEEALCAHCSLCAKENCCPVGAVRMPGEEKSNLPAIDPSECIRCGKCVELCPRGALTSRRLPERRT